MIYRVIIALVVSFWAGMTFLFIRSELFPESEARWRQLPPRHVLETMFREGESSELAIYYKNEKVGSLALYPLQQAMENRRQVTLRADVLVGAAGAERYRVRAEVLVRTDDAFAVQEGMVTVHVPKLALRLAVQLDRDRFSYELREEDEVIASDSGLVRELVQRGVPQLDLPGVVSLPQRITVPEISARLATLHVQGEPVDVFQVRLRHAPELDTLVYVSQVGRVLSVDTPFPIRFAAEGVDP